MYIAICEDDRNYNNLTKKQIQEYLNTKNINYHISVYEDGESLIAACQEGAYFDLIFLDIYMGMLNGLEVARELRKQKVSSAIIFLTTSRDFAVESYEVAAFSYLVKPVEEKLLVQVMERFLTEYQPVKVDLGGIVFSLVDLVYAESANKKTTLHFRDKSTRSTSLTFHESVDKLSFPNFLQCHRCYMVNLNHVRKIGDGYFLTITDERVLIRQKGYTTIKKLYYKYVLSQ